MSASRSRFAAATAAVLLASMVGVLALDATAAFADDPGGVGIIVTVSPAPVPDPAIVPGQPANGSAPSSGTGAFPTGGNANSTGGTGNTVVTGGTPARNPVPAADEFDLGGIVFVSGVTSSYTWSINPLGGESHAQFTVHNVSQYTIDSSAAFQMVGPFGNEITRVDNIRLDQLKPDESRVIEATLTGVGQWGFYTTHATFTPPESVGGTALTALTRDGFLFVPPWFPLVLLVLAIGAFAVLNLIRASVSAAGGSSVGGSPLPLGEALGGGAS